MNRGEVFGLINDERARQSVKWDKPHQWGAGDCSAQLHPLVKLAVLTEECGEVARAVHDQEPTEQLRTELTQVAAVAVAWMESL